MQKKQMLQDMSLDFSGATLTVSNSTISGQGPILVYLGAAERVDIVGSTIVSEYDFVFSPAVLSNAELSTETKALHTHLYSRFSAGQPRHRCYSHR